MIKYFESTAGITADQLQGFFVGWPNPPSPETHRRILDNSAHIVLAFDEDREQVVGFVNAISDNVLSAYIPLLEVLPEYQRQGIGRELMQRMLALLDGLYMIDLISNPAALDFYTKLGMTKEVGMSLKNFDRQSGRE